MSGGLVAIIALIAIAAGGAFFYMRNRKAESKLPPPPPQVPRFPFDRWDILFSPNMPPQMQLDTETGLYTFTFPNKDGVHYVTTCAPVLQTGQTVQIEFKIEGAGTIIANDGGVPARLRIYMQRRGDNLTGLGEYQFYRFWSSANVELTGPNEYALSVKFDPSLWIPVGGKQYIPGPNYEQDKANGFSLCLANAESVGFTFGGWSAGHGVFAQNGNPVFSLKRFVVD